MNKKRYRGKHGKLLTAGAVAELMGCSLQTAKNYLYKFNDPPCLEEIGNLIYEYRLKKDEKELNRYL